MLCPDLILILSQPELCVCVRVCVCVWVITNCESVHAREFLCMCVCVSDRQIMGCQKKRQVCVLVLSPLREEDQEKNREGGKGGWGEACIFI